MKKINILEPNILKNSKRDLIETLAKNQISTSSINIIKKFENKISVLSGSKFTVATNTGSSALYAGFKSLEIKDNDLIIMPSYTFIATATSCILAGGSPWFFDIEKNNLNLNLDQIENVLKNQTLKKGKYYFHKKSKQRIFAICPVYTLGFLPNLKRIKKIAKKYDLKIIEDAACALGSQFNQAKLSNYSDLVCYSFNGNKSFTAGGGGAVSTNNKKLYDKLVLSTTNGKTGQYFHESFGLNLKITGVHAAIGFGQLNNFNGILKRKNRIRENYKKFFQLNNIKFIDILNKKIILWLNFLICKKDINRKLILNAKKLNINFNFFWMPMHLQPIMRKYTAEDQKNTNNIWKKILVLPSSDNIKNSEQDKVKSFLKRNLKLIN